MTIEMCNYSHDIRVLVFPSSLGLPYRTQPVVWDEEGG